jgi:hypothetical protein
MEGIDFDKFMTIVDQMIDKVERENEMYGRFLMRDLYQVVNRSCPMDDRSFRRMVKGLGLKKDRTGFYNYGHALVIFGWIRRRQQFRSYAEFMDRAGQHIYRSTSGIDFGTFIAHGEGQVA